MISDLIYAAAVLTLTLGSSRESSVVARNPVAITAAVVLVSWPFVAPIVDGFLQDALGRDPMAVGLVPRLIPACAALIIVVLIGRAGTVPGRWRWVPAGVFAAAVILWVVPQLIMVLVGAENVQSLAVLLAATETISSQAGTVGLGVVAIYLATRVETRSTPIYPAE